VSLVSLANDHVQWFRTLAGSVRDDGTGQPAPKHAAAQGQQNSALSTALDTLAKYIPTEIVTLYITAVSLRTQIENFGVGGKAVFFIFLILTPVLLLLAFLGNAKKTTGALPPLKVWPFWKMIASTIAFAVWACAIPGNAWVASANAGISSLAALLASVILGLIGNVIEP